jgi:hypothetical protein
MRDYATVALDGFDTSARSSRPRFSKHRAVKHSGATKNRYVAAVRAFLKWGADDHRWPKDTPTSAATRFTTSEEARCVACCRCSRSRT